MTTLLWTLVALPLLTGAGLLVAGRRADRYAPLAAVATTAVATGLAIAVAVDRTRVVAPFLARLPVTLRVDGLSAVMVVTVAAVTLAVLAFAATADFAAEPGRHRFFGLMLLFAGAMLVTVTAADLLTLLMAWEVMGATSYALIGYWWRDPDRAASGTVAFLVTRAGDLGLYVAAGAALAGTGSMSLDALGGASSGWRHVVAAGLVLAAAGKSAQLPFSFWLSRAMAGPNPVSALLHSATMVAAGGYLLLRVAPLLADVAWSGHVVAWLGALTALALGAVAAAQRDLKQVLAASTCAQVGFMVLAAGTAAVAGGASFLVAHAATKSLLFLVAGGWLTVWGTKDLARLRGAAWRDPGLGVPFALGALTLAGLPPLSLWATKEEVLGGARHSTAGTALYVVALAATALSAVYSGRMLAAVFARDEAAPVPRRFPTLPVLPLDVLAAAAVGLAVLGIPAVAGEMRDLVGGERVDLAWWEPVLSAALALAAFGVAARAAGRAVPAPAFLRDWLRLEWTANRLVTRPVLALAAALGRFDDAVVAGGVTRAGRGLGAAARTADAVGERAVTGSVHAVATGARRLGRLARRPQTGQLHQYYAQIAVALALLAAVFVLVR